MTTRRAVICSQSNFATDYRIDKMRQTLISLGYDVTLLGRSHPHEDRANTPGIRYMRLLFWHGPLFYAELNIRLFLALVFSKSADLIVSIDLDTLAGCQAAARLLRIRLLWDSHELFPEVPEIANKPFVKKVWWTVQNFCVRRLRKTDIAVTVCQSIADIFKERYGRHFLVVRNAPLASRAKQLTNASPDSGRPFTLLYQGAVNVGRGIEETIQALPLMPSVRLVVVGGGDVLEDVKALAVKTGVDDRVNFVGRVPFSQLPPYMAAADMGLVFLRNLCLNYYYALPNRVFDFVQARLPILANRLPEIERIVKGEDVGLCIESLTHEAIAKAVIDIMNNRERLTLWRENMSTLSTKLTWDNETENLRHFLS